MVSSRDARFGFALDAVPVPGQGQVPNSLRELRRPSEDSLMDEQPRSSLPLFAVVMLVVLLAPARSIAVIFGYPLMPAGYSVLQLARDAIVGIAFWGCASTLCYRRLGHRGCYVIAVALGATTFFTLVAMAEGDLIGLAVVLGIAVSCAFGIVFWAAHHDGLI